MSADVYATVPRARPSDFMVWVQAVRVFSLTCSAMGVLTGSVAAAYDGYFSFGRFLLALLGAVAIQIGTNLINDYYDLLSGVDSAESPGSTKVVENGWLTLDDLRRGGILAFVVGSAIGLWLVYLCGMPLLWLGLASVAAGYFYTAKPLQYGYRYWGDLMAFLFLGPAIVMGAYFVMAGSFTLRALAVAIPLGCAGAGILQANNIRDREADMAHNKRTPATYFGPRGNYWELALLEFGGPAAAVFFALAGVLPWTMILTFLVTPHVLQALRIVAHETNRQKLHEAVPLTAKVHMELSLLIIIGFLLDRLI